MSEGPLSRRRVLKGVTGGLVAGAGLGWLAPAATWAPSEVSGATPVQTPADNPVAESDTAYAVYHYAPVSGEFRPTLPINLVAPLASATFSELTAVFEEAGWYPRPTAKARYAYDRDTDRWSRSHWAGAETVFGVARRLHVRCWELAGTASIQAHVDTVPRPSHRVYSLAAAEQSVATLFARAGWDVERGAAHLANAHPPDHDGRATVIRK